MPEIACNTSPIQYLHQLGLLELLPSLSSKILIPPAVVAELEVGRAKGIDLPQIQRIAWMEIRRPAEIKALPMVTDLGPGEVEVLALALETAGTVAVIDDGCARAIAEMMRIPLTGTLGILLSAKRAGLIREVSPLLDRLEKLRFHLAPHTRIAILKRAGESS